MGCENDGVMRVECCYPAGCCIFSMNGKPDTFRHPKHVIQILQQQASSALCPLCPLCTLCTLCTLFTLFTLCLPCLWMRNAFGVRPVDFRKTCPTSFMTDYSCSNWSNHDARQNICTTEVTWLHAGSHVADGFSARVCQGEQDVFSYTPNRCMVLLLLCPDYSTHKNTQVDEIIRLTGQRQQSDTWSGYDPFII